MNAWWGQNWFPGNQSWRYRPEDKVVNTSFDHTVDRTMIAGSAVSHLQLYATEPILVTLPNWEKEESCHITTFLSKGSSGAWMKEERDNSSRGGSLPTLPGLYLCAFQPSQRGFFRVHTFVWREREPEPNFQTFQGPRHQFHGIQITWTRESLVLYKSFKPLWADIQREIPLWHGAWKLNLFYILALSTLWLIPILSTRFCLGWSLWKQLRHFFAN